MPVSQIQSASLASGVPASSNMPAGSVLQVVQGTLTTAVSTSSVSFVTTGLTATITPKFSTSKILVIANGNADSAAAQYQLSLSIYRNSTNLSANGFCNAYNPSSRQIVSMGVNYLDSPATTSATTYSIYFASTNAAGAVVFNIGNGQGAQTAVITLIEIAQ